MQHANTTLIADCHDIDNKHHQHYGIDSCAMDYLGPGNEGVTPQAAAGILVERLKNAGDMGDRRDALEALLKLSQDHPSDVGHAGMPIFTDILQAGIADRSMTQTIMGIMLNLVTEQGANVSSFLKDVQNVQNLLDLLESTDALTALSAVQVRTRSGLCVYCCMLTSRSKARKNRHGIQ